MAMRASIQRSCCDGNVVNGFFKRFTHALSNVIDPISSPPLSIPEFETGFRPRFPGFAPDFGSMDLMAVPKKKISKHKRGIRNGPKALKPTPVIVRCTKSQAFQATIRLYSTTEYDISNAETRRQTLNRLLYRSKQRGLLELDLVLGKWVEDNIDSMDEKGIKSLIQVLDLENPDLWRWLSGQEQPPESIIENPVFTAIQEKVTSNLNSYAAPETRATPGQPWVRGWDDIKKGQYSPVSGNQ